MQKDVPAVASVLESQIGQILDLALWLTEQGVIEPSVVGHLLSTGVFPYFLNGSLCVCAADSTAAGCRRRSREQQLAAAVRVV